jgi:hypothetical protein
MQRVEHTPRCAASKHIARAAFLLNRAKHHLSAASSTIPDHYHQEQLHGLTLDLRQIDEPLFRLSSSLSGGER